MTTDYAIPRIANNIGGMAGIGTFIKERRGATTQKQLSELSGVDRAYIAQIENGRIALPGADIRRRLAEALGVSHLDMLMAAGEITEDEIVLAGASADPHDDPLRAELIDLIRGINWQPDQAQFAQQVLRQMFERGPR